MAHETQPDIAQKIWQGDYWGSNGAYALGLAQYRASDHGDRARIAWMSTLFSALGNVRPGAMRLKPLPMMRTIKCVLHLRSQINLYSRVHPEAPSADQLEVLGKIFFEWSRIPLIGRRSHLERARTFLLAAKSGNYTPSAHTSVLVLNTLAEIAIVDGNITGAVAMVEEALDLARFIHNPNQQSRAYRGLASLLKRTNGSQLARGAMNLADAVHGIDEDVRSKNDDMRRQLGF